MYVSDMKKEFKDKIKIIYLNNEITKREKELSNIKEHQLKLFRKQTKHSKNTVQNEMIFAALFGNGITV